MRIGLDFDNTLACYDHAFRRIAYEMGYLNSAATNLSKAQVKALVCSGEDGKKKWMALQGQVYGARIAEAQLFDDIANFMERARRGNHELCIVSHKTEFGHFDENRTNLREAALKWMESKKFFDCEGFDIDRNRVFFASTRSEKVATINQLKCNVFIDDLIEVLNHPSLDRNLQRILFAPHGIDEPVGEGILVCREWAGISRKLFEED